MSIQLWRGAYCRMNHPCMVPIQTGMVSVEGKTKNGQKEKSDQKRIKLTTISS